MNLNRGTNIRMVREKYEQRQEQKRGLYWKPKDAESRVRILPSPIENGSFYVETGYHQFDDEYLPCIKFTGQKCPVCEYVKKLYKGSASDVELAKAIKVKKQYLFNIIVRGDEYLKDEKGQNTNEVNIRILQAGVQIYEKIINAILDDDIGDITSVDKGFDVVIKKEQKPGEQYPKYTNTAISRKPTPLFDNERDIEYTLTHLKDLKQYVKTSTEEDLESALKQYLEYGAVTKTRNVDGEKEEHIAESKEDVKPVSKVDDIPSDVTTKVEQKQEVKATVEMKKETVVEKKENVTEKDEVDFKKWEQEFTDSI